MQTAPFQVWTKGCWAWDSYYEANVFRPPELVLDSSIGDERHFTMRQWRDFCKAHSGDRTLDILVVSLSPGCCDLAFSYEFDQDDCSVGSCARQRITSVKPPLLPDYDRRGKVNAMDVRAVLDQQRHLARR